MLAATWNGRIGLLSTLEWDQPTLGQPQPILCVPGAPCASYQMLCTDSPVWTVLGLNVETLEVALAATG